MVRPKPYVCAIIQARMGSKRLKGKVLKHLGRQTILEHVIKRVREAEKVHSVVVATPDKRISDLADNRGAYGFWYQGDPNDVLTRYVKAAEFDNCDIIVRITADCPLICGDIIDKAVEGLGNADISGNARVRSYPRGFDCEVFHRDVLYRLDRLASGPVREHVTLFAYQNQDLFVFNDVVQDRDMAAHNLSVNTTEDLEYVRRVYELSKPNVDSESIMRVLHESL